MGAAVGRLVNAVAVTHVVARIAFARSGPDRLIVGWIDRDRADCRDTLIVEDGIPRLTAVGGFPNPAARGAHVVEFGIRRRTGNPGDASSTGGGANFTPAHICKRRPGRRRGRG